jgi:hypothetical protein
MSSLADLPELLGFFTYSRKDDEYSQLSALRDRIQLELRAQLGRTAKTFRLWQDKEAIPAGTLWDAAIKDAVARSVFFIPTITPAEVASKYCRLELESFLEREAQPGRDDLIFPILYIDVPNLQDSARWQKDPVLSIIAKRQYVDWRELRYLDVNSTEVSRKVGQFCTHIRDALSRPSISPEERQKQEETERRRQEAETKRREDEARQEAAEAQARQLVEQEQRRHPAAAEQRREEEIREREKAARREARADHQNQRPGDVAVEKHAAEHDRRRPEYWLDRVVNVRRLKPGDEPMVFVSYASPDHTWISDLHKFLKPTIAELNDADGRPYYLWNFSDINRGTVPGDEFPEIVAERMWRCRAAIIILSADYVASQYCKNIELPFLMWRWEHHKLMRLPLKIGTVPVKGVRIPSFQGSPRRIVLDEIIDDRQAASDFATSRYRDYNFKELKEGKIKIESEIEKRLNGISHRVAEFLKTRYGAREEF